MSDSREQQLLQVRNRYMEQHYIQRADWLHVSDWIEIALEFAESQIAELTRQRERDCDELKIRVGQLEGSRGFDND